MPGQASRADVIQLLSRHTSEILMLESKAFRAAQGDFQPAMSLCYQGNLFAWGHGT